MPQLGQKSPVPFGLAAVEKSGNGGRVEGAEAPSAAWTARCGDPRRRHRYLKRSSSGDIESDFALEDREVKRAVIERTMFEVATAPPVPKR